MRRLHLSLLYVGHICIIKRPSSFVKGEANLILSVSKIVIRLRHRQYDPAIIERIIRLVFGPSRAFYRSFLKRCTLTNRAVGSLWRALSKPINRFNHASGVAVVTPTDRSKSFAIVV